MPYKLWHPAPERRHNVPYTEPFYYETVTVQGRMDGDVAYAVHPVTVEGLQLMGFQLLGFYEKPEDEPLTPPEIVARDTAIEQARRDKFTPKALKKEQSVGADQP